MQVKNRSAELDAAKQAELVCGWLGLSVADWPPNHYALLGLQPGESDTGRIEHQVHERMRLLRTYQIRNPEAATMAMNRLAQAYSCLTDRGAKRAYDEALLGPGQDDFEADVSERPTLPNTPVSGTTEDPLAWLFGPWSQLSLPSTTPPAQVQADWRTAPPPPVRETAHPSAEDQPPTKTNGEAEPAPPQATEAAPDEELDKPPVDERMAAARSSPSARRGLGTKRALYYRIARTRQLIRAWEQIGKFVAQPKRRLTRTSEAAEFTAALQSMLELRQGFPAILGAVGQPGYFVVILAQQQMPVPTFRALVLSQRDELARDWQDAHTLLRHHQQFLRQELRILRKKNIWGRALRSVRAFVRDEPGKFLIFLAILALVLALVLQTWLFP